MILWVITAEREEGLCSTRGGIGLSVSAFESRTMSAVSVKLHLHTLLDAGGNLYLHLVDVFEVTGVFASANSSGPGSVSSGLEALANPGQQAGVRFLLVSPHCIPYFPQAGLFRFSDLICRSDRQDTTIVFAYQVH